MPAQFTWPPVLKYKDGSASDSYSYYSDHNSGWYSPLYSSQFPNYVFCEQLYLQTQHQMMWRLRLSGASEASVHNNNFVAMTGVNGFTKVSDNGISLWGGTDGIYNADVWHVVPRDFSAGLATWSTVKAEDGTFRGLLCTRNEGAAQGVGRTHATTETFSSGAARGIVVGSDTTYFCFMQVSGAIRYVKADIAPYPHTLSSSATLFGSNTELWFMLDAGEGYYYAVYRLNGTHLAIRGVDFSSGSPVTTGLLGGSGANPWTDHTPLKCGNPRYITLGTDRFLAVQTLTSTITIQFTPGTKSAPTITRTARSVPFAATHYVVEADPAQTSEAYVVALSANYSGTVGDNILCYGSYAPLHNTATPFSSQDLIATLEPDVSSNDTLRSVGFSSAGLGESVPSIGIAGISSGSSYANTVTGVWNCWYTPVDHEVGVESTSSYSSVSVGSEIARFRGVVSDSIYSYGLVGFAVPGYLGDDFQWDITDSNEYVSGVNSVSTYSSVSLEGSVYHPIESLPFSQFWTNVGYTYMDDFMVYINQDRAAVGLPPYKTFGADGLFSQRVDIANYHATQMSFTRIYGHEDPAFNQGWQTVPERIDRVPATSGAENIQYVTIRDLETSNPNSYPTAYELWDVWTNSPVHYANITYNWGAKNTSAYSQLGVGEGWYELSLGDSYSWAKLAYACNMFLVLETLVIESTIQQFWDNAGALSTVLGQRWSNDAWVKALASHHSSYAIRVASGHESIWGCRVAAQLASPFFYEIATSFYSPYVSTDIDVSAETYALYEIKDTESVSTQRDHPYALSVSSGLSFDYSLMPNTAVQLSAEYRILDIENVVAYMQADYVSVVSKEISCFYSLMVTPSRQVSHPYGDVVEVVNQFDSMYDFLSTNIVAKQHYAYYFMQDFSSVSVTDNQVAIVTASGLRIPIDDAVLESTEGDVGYTFECAIADLSVYSLIKEDDPIVVDFCGEIYNLLVSSKSMTRDGPARAAFRVQANNAVMRLGSPYSPEIDYTQELEAQISDIVDGLSEIDFTYEIVDWLLPANRLEISGASVLSILEQIASAPGGVVDGDIDGSMRIRYPYPYPMNSLSSPSPDQTYTEEYDNISVSTNTEYREGHNRFRIREGEAVFQDLMEWVPDDPQTDPVYQTGTLKVYLSPYRSTASVVHLGNAVSVSAPVELEETLEELVEFNEGTGRTSRPIHSVVSSEWITASLGAISHAPYSDTINSGTSVNSGYGLAKVVYTTKYLSVRVSGVPAEVEANKVGPASSYAYFILEESSA